MCIPVWGGNEGREYQLGQDMISWLVPIPLSVIMAKYLAGLSTCILQVSKPKEKWIITPGKKIERFFFF